jgi:hypothetical protein
LSRRQLKKINLKFRFRQNFGDGDGTGVLQRRRVDRREREVLPAACLQQDDAQPAAKSKMSICLVM